jgi:biopolymer transport protein ExbD
MKLGWLLCVVCACKGSSSQSFTEAMQLVCDAPSTHDASYFKTHLSNPEVIREFAAIGDSSPADRMTRMRAAVAKAGLASCKLLDQMAAVTIEHAPKVAAAPGAIDLDDRSPVVIATPTAIVIDGKAILQLTDGQPTADELQGSAHDIKLPRVTSFLKATLEELSRHGAVPRLALVVDPQLTYKLFIQLVYSAKQAGFRDFGIVVTVGTATKVIPITLPDKAPPVPGALGLMLGVTSKNLLLWSISGQEGTLQAPKVTTTRTDELAKALADIATRHAADKDIIVMADEPTPMQAVAEAYAVVRKTADGHDLFPTILLSAGFE